MAKRPVYVVGNSKAPCVTEQIEFVFYSGFSVQQKQRSIASLHMAFCEKSPGMKVLEVSSKSKEDIGIALSAFHLKYQMDDMRKIPVENVFQSGKVFNNGGPYLDILDKTPRDAKRDERLRTSGDLVKFQLQNEVFPLSPTTYFYDWVYINALWMNQELLIQASKYDAFSDIEFNPERSLNCQAKALATAVFLYREGLLEKALSSKENFLNMVYPE